MRSHDCRLRQIRAKPKAEKIATAILENAAILNLQTTRLIRDICERFQCDGRTAKDALAIARAA